MEKEIMVYFNSGNKARLSAGNTMIVEFVDDVKILEAVDAGKQVVNWNNVSFIRKFEEREAEE